VVLHLAGWKGPGCMHDRGTLVRRFGVYPHVGEVIMHIRFYLGCPLTRLPSITPSLLALCPVIITLYPSQFLIMVLSSWTCMHLPKFSPRRLRVARMCSCTYVCSRRQGETFPTVGHKQTLPCPSCADNVEFEDNPPAAKRAKSLCTLKNRELTGMIHKRASLS